MKLMIPAQKIAGAPWQTYHIASRNVSDSDHCPGHNVIRNAQNTWEQKSANRNKAVPCTHGGGNEDAESFKMGPPKKVTMRVATISLMWSLLGAVLAFIAMRWTRVSTWLSDEFPEATRPRFLPQFYDEYPNDVVNLTRKLVPQSEEEVAHYALRWLRTRNMSASLHPVPGARYNLLALAKGASVSEAQVLLSTHFDLVPGGPTLDLSGKDGKLVGRGTVDARGIMAAMMVTVAQMADHRVAAVFVSGEETDHAGMREASSAFEIASSVTLINGEPTESRVAKSQKGMLKLKIVADGVACHSGYPHLGRSAIDLLLNVLGRLRETEWPRSAKRDGSAVAYETTMNIGRIEGGEAPNIVPARAEATVVFRLIGEPAQVLQKVEQIVSEVEGTSVELLTQNPPISFFVPTKTAKRLGIVEVAYNTDVAHFAREYKRAVLFGAGSIEVAHTNQESIDIRELEALPTLYTEIVEEILELEQ